MPQHTSKRVEDHQKEKRRKLVLWLVLVAIGIGSIKAHADAVSDWSAVATTAAAAQCAQVAQCWPPLTLPMSMWRFMMPLMPLMGATHSFSDPADGCSS